MTALSSLDCRGVIVTAPGDDSDFVSRFFAPRVGIPEDPVTGSAHSALIPYWSARLGKSKMFARQLSRRGGELFCEARGERVGIGGRAKLYSRAQLEIG
jgi:predicted PhzF superfamily epimerase YddE/YHI9